jgi:hypothetical protein
VKPRGEVLSAFACDQRREQVAQGGVRAEPRASGRPGCQFDHNAPRSRRPRGARVIPVSSVATKAGCSASFERVEAEAERGDASTLSRAQTAPYGSDNITGEGQAVFTRRLAVAVALIAGVIGSQGPEFAEQYRQRMGGALDELRRIVAQFNAAAARQGLTTPQAVGRLEQNTEPLARDGSGAASQEAQPA